MEGTVSVLGCGSYDRAAVDAVVERHFAALEQEGPLIRPGMRVVIKPNLVMRRSPDDASTTHPAFVAAVIRAVMKRGGICTIAESPGGPYTPALLRSVYAGTGMNEVALQTGAALNENVESREVSAKDPLLCHSFRLIVPVLEADLVISVAKLKTHSMMGFTGAVKNLFGCVPGLLKPDFHFRFKERAQFGDMLVDLCQTVGPGLSLVDGVWAMEGNGPTGGSPRFMGVTFAARNPHALDLAAAAAVGFAPDEVETLRSAVERGLCPDSSEKLPLVGDPLSDFVIRDFKKPQSRNLDFLHRLPAPLRRLPEWFLESRPAVRRETCVGCGKCAESCPQHAITLVQKKASIDYRKCIRCYCCHEMCPFRSIDIRRWRLLR